jgi:predicted transposase YdaD
MEHDAAYKGLFSHPEMVADLLRGFVPEPWVPQIDFSTLELVSGSYVSDDLRTREELKVELYGGLFSVCG